MEELWSRIVENFSGRLTGPLNFRILLQPIMAVVIAVIDGIKDAKGGKPAYFWAIFAGSAQPKELIKSGWKSVGKIFILAVVLDIVYQLKAHSRIYPGEIIIVSILLAILPYVLLRGPVNRLMSLVKGKRD